MTGPGITRKRSSYAAFVVLALLGATPAAAAGAAPPTALTPIAATPCETVAAAARRVPAADWAKGEPWSHEAALAPTLRIEQGWSTYPSTDPEPFARAREIATDPTVAKAIYAGDMWTTFVEHLAGTELYEAFTVQGTLHVQEIAFVIGRPGTPPRIVATPPSARGGEWTTSEDLGTVAGRPFIVDHGRNDPTGLDQDIQLTPWLGDRWGAACRVALTFASAYPVRERYCGDAAVCAAAAGIAGEAARAFDRRQPADKAAFRFGPRPSAMAEAAANRTDTQSVVDGRPDFPLFNAQTTDVRSFGGDGATPFALVLNGHSYLALIGHAGVGWRTSTTVLLAIYTIDATPKPLAGIVVERTIAGLDRAEVLPAKLDREQH